MMNASVAGTRPRGAETWSASRVQSDEWRRRAEDQQLAAMQRVFLATGGVVTSDQFIGLLRRRASQPISVLARWIVAREVVSLSWHGQVMIPLFQFDAARMELLESIPPILGELVGVFDDWDIAQWFATPNAWTEGVAPAEVLRRDGLAVLKAARGDRFLLRG